MLFCGSVLQASVQHRGASCCRQACFLPCYIFIQCRGCLWQWQQLCRIALACCGVLLLLLPDPHCRPQDVGRLENIVGWYHSHPGYGCWLSGIDCSTQMLNQQYQVCMQTTVTGCASS